MDELKKLKSELALSKPQQIVSLSSESAFNIKKAQEKRTRETSHLKLPQIAIIVPSERK